MTLCCKMGLWMSQNNLVYICMTALLVTYLIDRNRVFFCVSAICELNHVHQVCGSKGAVNHYLERLGLGHESLDDTKDI